MSIYDDEMARLRSSSLFDKETQPISAWDVARVEKEIGSTLPSQYAEFLIKYGGHAPGGYALFSYLEPYPRGKKGILDLFFGIRESDAYDLVVNHQIYKGRIPRNLLPIGSDPGGNLICLCLSGLRKGAVYFWDHEREEVPPKGIEPGYSNVYLISTSFEDFLRTLELEEFDEA